MPDNEWTEDEIVLDDGEGIELDTSSGLIKKVRAGEWDDDLAVKPNPGPARPLEVEDTPVRGTPIPDTSRLPAVEAPPPPPPPARAFRASGKTVGVCSGPGCGATWSGGVSVPKFHSHSHPVPGSKSRVTYTNHPVTRVEG